MSLHTLYTIQFRYPSCTRAYNTLNAEFLHNSTTRCHISCHPEARGNDVYNSVASKQLKAGYPPITTVRVTSAQMRHGIRHELFMKRYVISLLFPASLTTSSTPVRPAPRPGRHESRLPAKPINTTPPVMQSSSRDHLHQERRDYTLGTTAPRHSAL